MIKANICRYVFDEKIPIEIFIIMMVYIVLHYFFKKIKRKDDFFKEKNPCFFSSSQIAERYLQKSCCAL